MENKKIFLDKTIQLEDNINQLYELITKLYFNVHDLKLDKQPNFSKELKELQQELNIFNTLQNNIQTNLSIQNQLLKNIEFCLKSNQEEHSKFETRLKELEFLIF